MTQTKSYAVKPPQVGQSNGVQVTPDPALAQLLGQLVDEQKRTNAILRARNRKTDKQNNKILRQLRRHTAAAEANIKWILLGAGYLWLTGIAVYDASEYLLIQASQTQIGQWLGVKAPVTGELFLGEETPIADGEVFYGPNEEEYFVSSPRGMRDIGDSRGYHMHQGVDVAAPEGTPLYAPVDLKNNCFGTKDGRGNVAQWMLGDDISVEYIHLSRCYEGNKKAGDLMAEVGNTGHSFGAHLDAKFKKNGEYIEPSRQIIAATFSGQPVSLIGNGDFVSAYIAAISEKESGHNYTAINPDSGALGRYQFMPGTMRSTAQSCIGRVPTTSEFLNSSELQDQIMYCFVQGKLETIQGKTSDPVTQCRMMASIHYSGNPDLWNSTRPQTYGGNSYPSIASYTADVCKNFGQ
jgi:murein DD-endopeptidase MepM/ murein hydrolase activator NlpD